VRKVHLVGFITHVCEKSINQLKNKTVDTLSSAITIHTILLVKISQS